MSKIDAADQVSQYTYDGMGRRTKDSTRNYAWDMASNLTGYSGADGSATFTYDAFGFRTSASSGGSTRNYVLNYAMLLPALSTVQAGSSDLRYYVYFPNGMLLYSVEEADNSRRFYHFDEMGSTTALTDDSGKVVASYGITPYGETVSQTANVDNPFTFLGAYGVMQEGSTGLYYIRRRYYDSAAAAFLSPDPVRSRVPKRINPYQYSRANPLFYRDVTGLDEGWDYGFKDYPNGTGNWHESPDGDVTGVYRPKRPKKKDPVKAAAAAVQAAAGAGAGAAGGAAPETPGAGGGTQDWNEILKTLKPQAHPPMGSERQAHPPMGSSLPQSQPNGSNATGAGTSSGSGSAVFDTEAFDKWFRKYMQTISSPSTTGPGKAPLVSTSSVESGPKETGGTNQQPSNAPVQRQWYEWGWGYYYDQYDEWWYGDPWGVYNNWYFYSPGTGWYETIYPIYPVKPKCIDLVPDEDEPKSDPVPCKPLIIG